MARMPSTLGERVTPVSNRPIVDIDSTITARAAARDAAITGAAVQNLGQGLTDAAATGYKVRERQNQSAYAEAKSAFLKDKIAADSAFDQDHDYLTIPKRYGDMVGKSRKAAISMIKDPLLRRQFEMESELDVARGQQAINGLARGKEVDQGRAKLSGALDANVQAATMTSDTETRAGLLQASNVAINSAIAQGYISEAEGQNQRESAAHSYTLLRQEALAGEYDDKALDLARAAYASGDVDTAISNLNDLSSSYQGSLPADELAKMYRQNKEHLILMALTSPNVDPTDALRHLNGSAAIDNPPKLPQASRDFTGAIEFAEATPDGRPSPAGALGVMQILPSTAREVAGELGIPYDADRLQHDATYNRQIGTAYLNKMLTKYGGDTLLASAAYNAGPGRVDEWIQKFGDPRKGEISPADFAARIPIDETRAYVKRVQNRMGGGSYGPPDVAAMQASGVVKPGPIDYNTKLSAEDEVKFQTWVKDNKVPFDPTLAQSDYDMRGFWQALQQNDPKAKAAVDPNDNLLHYPDYWKTPLHKTFSNESQWAGPNAPHWTADDKLVRPDGSVQFDDKAGGPNRSLAAEISPEKLPALQAQIEARLREQEATADADRKIVQDDAKGKFTAHLQSLAATGKGLNGFNLEDYEHAFDPETFASMQRQEQDAERLNRWVGPLTTGTQDDVQRILKEAEPVPGSLDFEQQTKDFEAVQKAAAERQKQIDADPAAYAVMYDPVAKAAFQAMQTGQGESDNRPSLASMAPDAIRNAQIRMGVDINDVRAMPGAVSAHFAEEVQKAGVDQVGPMLDQITATWGDDGLAQVANEKGVGPSVKLAAFVDNPRDGLIRQHMIEAGRIGTEDMNKTVEERGYTQDNIKDAVDNVAGPLLDTMPVESARPYMDGLRQTTAYLVGRGMTPADAAKAAWAPFDRTYTFRDTYRIPKQFDAGRIDTQLSAFIGKLQPGDIETRSTHMDPLLPADYVQGQALQQVKDDPIWVTNPSDTGVILTYGDGGSPGDPVMTKDGKRVELLFRDMAQPPVEASPPPSIGGRNGSPVGGAQTAGPAQPKAPPKPRGGQPMDQPVGTLRKLDSMFHTDDALRRRAAKGDKAAADELKLRGL